MAYNNIVVINSWLTQIVGLAVWGIAIGPAGFHVELGTIHSDLPADPRGDFSLWVQSRVEIRNNNIFYESDPFPPESDQLVIERLMENAKVVSARVDEVGYGLVLLLSNGSVFHCIPGIEIQETPWMFYNDIVTPTQYFIVHRDLLDGPLSDK